jgi:hypothetical protein
MRLPSAQRRSRVNGAKECTGLREALPGIEHDTKGDLVSSGAILLGARGTQEDLGLANNKARVCGGGSSTTRKSCCSLLFLPAPKTSATGSPFAARHAARPEMGEVPALRRPLRTRSPRASLRSKSATEAVGGHGISRCRRCPSGARCREKRPTRRPLWKQGVVMKCPVPIHGSLVM